MTNQTSDATHRDQEMTSSTPELIRDAGTEATNDAAIAPIDATWARLVPGSQKAATAIVELDDAMDEDDDEVPADESPIAGRQKSNVEAD